MSALLPLLSALRFHGSTTVLHSFKRKYHAKGLLPRCRYFTDPNLINRVNWPLGTLVQSVSSQSDSSGQDKEREERQILSSEDTTDGYKTGYNQSVDAKFRSVIDAVDRLRDVLDGIDGDDFSLPAIAVIGNQSSGKSSILERLSGVDLPRGEGMVTRCGKEIHGSHRIFVCFLLIFSCYFILASPALVMRLKTKDVDVPEISIRYGDGILEPVAADQVANKIRAITDEIAPGGEINADVKIDLLVQSRDVPDLTLIDLPGIAYSDDVGSDGAVVFARIKALYEKYITSESCVMLCVMPASLEMATQQAAAMAKSVDPEMKRTIGVVTKIDTIEASMGSSIVRRLSGEGVGAWRFTLGCHAVRNRDQTQINTGATRADVDKAETLFFQTHKELSQAPKQWSADTLGFVSLVNKLTDVQVSSLRIDASAVPSIHIHACVLCGAVSQNQRELPKDREEDPPEA